MPSTRLILFHSLLCAIMIADYYIKLIIVMCLKRENAWSGHRRRRHFVMIWFCVLVSAPKRMHHLFIVIVCIARERNAMPSIEKRPPCTEGVCRPTTPRRPLHWVNLTLIYTISLVRNIICVNILFIWRVNSKLLLLIRTEIVGTSEAWSCEWPCSQASKSFSQCHWTSNYIGFIYRQFLHIRKHTVL